MGNANSLDIEAQEKYVRQESQKLPTHIKNKYNSLQIAGKLRQEYNNVSQKDAYILDSDWRR